jgi:hypothetical protein
MRTPIAALALSLVAGTFLHAQAGVDFSGNWILESPATADTPTALSVRQSVTTTTVRGEPMQPWFSHISIEREVGGRHRVEEHRIGIRGGVVGGPVGGRGGDPGTAEALRQHFSVTWSANALVFERGSHTGLSPGTGEWTERRETWSLDADGRLHVVISTRGSGEEPRTVAAVYRRQ